MYDAVFRNIAERMGRLIILLVNNLFGTDFKGDEELIYKPAEGTKPGTKGAQRQIRADSHFTIVDKDGKRHTFHIECQVRKDGTIILRIAEYDLMLAFQNAVKHDDETYTVDFILPRSAIILLRSTRGKADTWMYRFIDGDEVVLERRIEVLSVADTPLDDMFEKKLYALLPFYLFTHGDDLKRIAESDDERQQLVEQSRRIHEYIINEESLSAEEKIRLLQLTLQVIPALIRDEELRKEITDAMYPQTIELEIDKYGDACRAEGRVEGRVEGRAEEIIDMGLDLNLSKDKIIARLMNKCGMSTEQAREAYETLAAKHSTDNVPLDKR